MKMAVTEQERPWALGEYGQEPMGSDSDLWHCDCVGLRQGYLELECEAPQAATGRSEEVLTLVSEWNGTLGLEQPETTRNRELWNQGDHGNGFSKVHNKNLWGRSSDRNITGREL